MVVWFTLAENIRFWLNILFGLSSLFATSWLNFFAAAFSTYITTIFLCIAGVTGIKVWRTKQSLQRTLFVAREVSRALIMFAFAQAALRIVMLSYRKMDELYHHYNRKKENESKDDVARYLRNATVFFTWAGYTHALVCYYFDLPKISKANSTLNSMLTSIHHAVNFAGLGHIVAPAYKAAAYFRQGSDQVFYDQIVTPPTSVEDALNRAHNKSDPPIIHMWKSAPGSSRCCYCHHDRDHEIHDMEYSTDLLAKMGLPKKETEGVVEDMSFYKEKNYYYYLWSVSQTL